MLASVVGAAVAVLVAALPPPPDKVVRETKSYGTVTLDHKAHLALRVACKACHGPGRVGKIDFTPRSAHDACRGCHVERAQGPTSCKGCHVIPPKPDPAVVAAEAAASEPGTVVVATATGAATGVKMVPSHATGAPAAVPMSLSPRSTGRFTRSFEAGLHAVVGEHQDLVFGPSIQLVARSGEATVMAYTLDVAGGTGDGRTRFLVGGGREWRLNPGIRATALAIGGLDATHSPVTAMPAVGLRGGLEFMSLTRTRWSMVLSVTALTDLVRTGAMGDRTGGTTVGVTLAGSRPLTR